MMHMIPSLVGLLCFASPISAQTQEPLPPAKSFAPSNVSRLMEQGRAFQNNKEYLLAIDCFVKVIKIDRDQTEAWERLAWLFNERKEYRGAVTSALVVIKHNPENSNAWRELGYAYWHQDRPDDAMRCLIRSLELNEFNFPAYDYMAGLLEDLGRPDLADKVRAKKAAAEKRQSPRIEL